MQSPTGSPRANQSRGWAEPAKLQGEGEATSAFLLRDACSVRGQEGGGEHPYQLGVKVSLIRHLIPDRPVRNLATE